MMKYSVSRKLNLGKRAGLDYETMDLMVLEADSRKEAMEELELWKSEVLDQIEQAKQTQADNQLNEEFKQLGRK
jgi:hypothetical protein